MTGWLTVGHFKLTVITQPLSKLTLLKEQAVSITDYTGHGPWSCKTIYADASVNSRMTGSVPGCFSRQGKEEGFCLKVTSTGDQALSLGQKRENGAMVALHISGCQWPPGKAFKLEKHIKNCRQQRDVVQHLPARKRKQDTLTPTATKKLWAALSKVAAQNQLKKTLFLKY